MQVIGHPLSRRELRAQLLKVKENGTKGEPSQGCPSRDAHVVKMHRADNSVSSNPKNNNFISAGPIKIVHRDSLNEVYPGGMCEGAICSYRAGAERFWLCVCGGKRSHDLPDTSGPDDKANWSKVMKKSNEARRLCLDKLKRKRKR